MRERKGEMSPMIESLGGDALSPHEGESALGLLFGVIPAVLGAMIAAYLLVRIVRDRQLKRKVNAERPDPRKFADYPELQAMVDRLYLLRFKGKQRMSGASAKERDAHTRQMDALIEEGLARAEALRVAATPEAIAAARASMAELQGELEQVALRGA